MKIGIIAQPTDRIPSDGSIAIWIEEVSTRLARTHPVVVISRRFDGQAVEEGSPSLRHVRLAADRDARTESRLRRLELRLDRLTRRRASVFYRYYYFSRRYYSRYAVEAAEVSRQHGVDALVVPNHLQFLPTFRASLPDTRLALLMQCDWLVELERSHAHGWARHADLLLGCSDYIARGIRQRFPEFADRTFAVHNGSSLEALERDEVRSGDAPDLPPAECKSILFVGRITPEKGVHVLLDAMERVLETHEDALLLICGGFRFNPPSPALWVSRHRQAQRFERMKSQYERSLRERAAKMGDRVRFLGSVPHHQLAQLYQRGRMLVHPSLWDEPFGMILTEAMACAIPVVSTKMGGIPEIVVEGETGLLVEPGDANALAKAITQLLSDEERASEMGRRGRERLRTTFTWDHTAERLRALLEAPG